MIRISCSTLRFSSRAGSSSSVGTSIVRSLHVNNTLFLKNSRKNEPFFWYYGKNACHRCYTPLTSPEEEAEKARVAKLSDQAKELELRQLNREIARLEMLKGINTGELYTWRGKYKNLARDYAAPLFMWYWSCFGGTLIMSYFAIEWGGVDVMAVMVKLDHWTGYDISGSIKPEYGKIGLALALNEALEVVRLPFVILTVRPVMNRLFPPKY